MRPSRELVAELEQDLRRAAAGKVLYLEGRTDVPVFLALLGQHAETIPPEGWGIDGVWIRGLGARRGSGGSAVRSRVRVARELGYGSMRGLVDGDGEDYESLSSAFGEPAAGEPHRWPTYCIENGLPLVGWPPSLGAEPIWHDVLMAYVPYAALNRVVASTQRQLSSLEERSRRWRPSRGRLERVQASSMGGVEALAAFDAEVERCRAAIGRSLQHGHALVNGKWLVEHHAAVASRSSAEECRRVWSDHVASCGGHPEVRTWWQRFVVS